ncbi:hypothetical protein LEN26_016813 [Aphanomyces euteiches]|uniref:Uncharacterized protein n=1 Tax=Aphanomyces euteiches TaxID=100861 RepID=A0A6G0WJ37_9STRA|nr:hypothetical protein Ae201684_014737 [Aphanomyces euteiches]KAH9078823.1 hypothetical protein Ae201684P_019893 [Aphanomyces euteiches]KAH9098009.1 hypothetical protein LEN26_016813 [Aphanomyces euteiches]KAH9129856.1 hypothetical protein AeMF1_000122 [Aphanomyces euteiches]KAH9157989.1 hypothetical protein AeRB84_000227 [Aphanomyces euteiches]
MKFITCTRFVTIMAAALTTVVEGDNRTTFAADEPSFQFNLDQVGGFPTDDQLVIMDKWTSTDFSSHTDFFLYSPRSPRNQAAISRFSFRQRSFSGNFSEVDIVMV